MQHRILGRTGPIVAILALQVWALPAYEQPLIQGDGRLDVVFPNDRDPYDLSQGELVYDTTGRRLLLIRPTFEVLDLASNERPPLRPAGLDRDDLDRGHRSRGQRPTPHLPRFLSCGL